MNIQLHHVEEVSGDTLGKIYAAADSQVMLSFNYTDKDGQQTLRLVEPYELKDNKLYAYCTASRGIRAFQFGNILLARVTDQKFEPRWPIKIASVTKS